MTPNQDLRDLLDRFQQHDDQRHLSVGGQDVAFIGPQAGRLADDLLARNDPAQRGDDLVTAREHIDIHFRHADRHRRPAINDTRSAAKASQASSTTTVAPRAAKVPAAAAPIPRVDPVTIAALPAKGYARSEQGMGELRMMCHSVCGSTTGPLWSIRVRPAAGGS